MNLLGSYGVCVYIKHQRNGTNKRMKKVRKTMHHAVIVRFGEEPRIHRQGVIQSFHKYNKLPIEYSVKFPDEKLVYFYTENRMRKIQKKL